MVDITGISDTESDTPYVVTLTGTDASSFSSITKCKWNCLDLLPGEYDYNVVVTDDYSKSTTYSRSLIVSQSDTVYFRWRYYFLYYRMVQDGDVFR